jgi:pyruvate/2-oxoglutarate dehydrogenase complex dihydrolipoamide acyltransferase (E2) component
MRKEKRPPRRDETFGDGQRGETGREKTQQPRRATSVPARTVERPASRGDRMSKFQPARWSGGGTGKRSVQANATAEPELEQEPEPTSDGPDATDAARALAAEHGINLADVTATGATGITKGDVETFIEAHTEPEPELVEPPEPIPDEADTPPPDATSLTADQA